MPILALGLNHRTAPLALREKVAFAPEAVLPALRELTSALTDASGEASEAAILSTCNRTEIYYRHAAHDAHPAADPQPVLDWFSDHTGFAHADLADSLYHFPDEQAVKHAFRVASGLDSMVLGEPQILGQMKSAFHTAADAGTTGKILHRLFQHTFSVAKRVRTDTAIGAHSVSVAHTGVRLAQQIFTDLGEQTALLIGAGETIELVARHLKENGVGAIIIAGRSIERAQTVADTVGGEAIALRQLSERLSRADIVVSSTASQLPILGKGAVERAMAQRAAKSNAAMFILDLAVPRDVEAEVRDVRGVQLYTVDDLNSVVEHNRDLRMRAAEQAEIIIDLQVVRFMRWMRALESVPVITALRDETNRVRDAEVEAARRKIAAGDDPDTVVGQLARDLTRKFTHHPSRALRQASMDGQPGLLTAARKLFGL